MTLHSHFRRYPTGFIEPCQPIGGTKPPSGPGWIHEIKHDGFRMMAQRRGVDGRLLTRNGNDWTDRYPSVAGAICALKVKSCLIDGEITVCDGRGLAVFDLLRHGSQIKTEAVLFAFDLLELDGEDLRPMPIEARKHKLALARAQCRLRPAPVRAPSRRRDRNLRTRLQARLRGHRQQAGGLALCHRPHR
jgi:ATP-dependent DNA ligase